MGILQNTADDLSAPAVAAHDHGRRRLTVRLVAMRGSKGDAIDPGSQRIRAIEGRGWEVDHFSVVPNEKGRVDNMLARAPYLRKLL
ncbi:hypothetical protein [Saccharopolyspora spinosa]|uniref:Uncharacterized protein n=1 Tax=Saccharopolyspora spinosa TaxID=60894 RepID=A0A2N3XVC6_SACSN|nr:hypothetical protein [Saccharopolyspora spinosa]PKW14616.1 hypothetical protein A8926_2246 [Saccharopolyspora spinosa]